MVGPTNFQPRFFSAFDKATDSGEVETVCDRVAILNHGELKALGKVSDLVTAHESNLEQVFLQTVGYREEALV